MIAVIDYGMGNLRSVQKALEVVGAKTRLTADPKDIKRCEKIVFPGVGSFGDAMKELRRRTLVEPIKEAMSEGKPFLGLCLGMQLLFEKSEESPGVKGLCVLRGEVKRFRGPCFVNCDSGKKLKVPHMGWNNIIRSTIYDPRYTILKGVSNGAYMYFVHSYYVKPKEKGVVLTTTDYGINFASGVKKDNIYGLQFHPEKSQAIGLKILENFIRI